MADFADIALEYEQIKDKPEELDKLRKKHNEDTEGRSSADDFQARQKILPSKEVHHKLETKFATMFDKSSRAGAQTSLGGLIMPNGVKNFNEFHDKYTGTGRIQKKEPMTFKPNDNAPKVDTRRDMAMLYERCMDCMERVDQDNCEVNAFIIPPFEKLAPQEAHKWQSVGLKPGYWVCYLYCKDCPQKKARKLKEIKNDPITTAIMVPGPGGQPMSLAERRTQEFLAEESARVSDHVIQAFKAERDNPDSQAFWGAARITS